LSSCWGQTMRMALSNALYKRDAVRTGSAYDKLRLCRTRIQFGLMRTIASECQPLVEIVEKEVIFVLDDALFLEEAHFSAEVFAYVFCRLCLI
jgi:hypothetical protein